MLLKVGPGGTSLRTAGVWKILSTAVYGDTDHGFMLMKICFSTSRPRYFKHTSSLTPLSLANGRDGLESDIQRGKASLPLHTSCLSWTPQMLTKVTSGPDCISA